MLVDDVGDYGLVVGLGEGAVLVLHQQHEALELLVVVESAWGAGSRELRAESAELLLGRGRPRPEPRGDGGEVFAVGIGAGGGVACGDRAGHEGAVGRELGVAPHPVGVLEQGVAVGCGEEVVELVAMQTGGDDGAVGLEQPAGLGVGRHGKRLGGAQQQRCRQG